MKDHSTRKHARLSASASDRWLNCTGSIRLIEAMPPEQRNRETTYAHRGTVLHQIAENVLIFDEGPDPWEVVDGYTVTEDDLIGVAVYTDLLDMYMANASWFATEIALDLASIHPDLGGTADFACITKAGQLVIVDFKAGQGVMVSPVGNPQAMQYALGVLNTIPPGERAKIKSVQIVIVQPFAPVGDLIKPWETDVATLLEHAVAIQEAAEKSLAAVPTFRAGSWCRWCPAMHVCPLMNEEYNAMGSNVVAPAELSADKMGDILLKAQLLRPWLDEVYARALLLAEQGVTIPNMKLVPKRATRKWIEPDFIPVLLEQMGYKDDDIYTKKVVSPAQAEKGLGKKVYNESLAPHVEKVSSGHNLVPAYDEVKGPDLTPSLPSPKSLGLK